MGRRDGDREALEHTPGDGARALAFSLVLAAVGLAACGSLSTVPPASGTGPSGGTGTSGPGTTLLTGGSATPKEAASRWWYALAKGDNSEACGYVLPSQRANCSSAFQHGGAGITDPGVGNAFVDGTQALVAVLTKSACFAYGTGTTTTMCFSNSNPDGGLPASDAGFAAAQQNASSIEGTLVECGELDGLWFVELETPGSGTTGVSGPSGATGVPASST